MSDTLSSAFADTKPHYNILDGLRGVAALTVVCFHLFEAYATSHLDQKINHGYLAVDFSLFYPDSLLAMLMMIGGKQCVLLTFLNVGLFVCILWSLSERLLSCNVLFSRLFCLGCFTGARSGADNCYANECSSDSGNSLVWKFEA